MPMATTPVMAFPVEPFHSPDRTYEHQPDATCKRAGCC